MNVKKIRNSILLVITAAIWGFAFVAQSVGGEEAGPFIFNFVRFIIGAIVLLPVIGVKKALKKDASAPKTKEEKHTLLLGGLFCGLSLGIASSCQQAGITMGTAAGKAGFITACYILIVPILGIFLKKKCPWTVWIGVVLTLAGLFLLCINPSEGFRVSTGEILLIICAFCFSIQIMFIDKYSPMVDGVRLSALQFAVAGVISFVPTFIFEMNCNITKFTAVFCNCFKPAALIPILYAGILSCGVAYTLQIIGQDGLNPTVASLIMSLESVFSVIGGWIILGEKLSIKELIGCVLMFAAICLAQITPKSRTKNQN